MGVELRPRNGVELVGKYEGSGRDSERYLAKRPDGAFVELTKLLYLVASSLDGHRTSTEVATIVGKQIDMDVTAENVDYLIEKLLPLGLFETETAELERPEMVLGLRVKKHVVPAGLVSAMTRVFKHLFHLPIVLAVMAAFTITIVQIFRGGNLRNGASALVNKPQLALVVFGLMLFSIVFHEIGHASACRFGGAKPGEIGGGLYLMFPSLYTNVTDAYRLNRAGRVRTDLGGIYFNAVFSVGLGIAYYYTHYTPLVLAIATTALLMLEQLLPFVRFDGYWIVSDLAGVPDLFPRLTGALRRLSPFPGARARHAHHRGVGVGVTDLRPYSRRIIVVWALFTVVILPIELILTLLLSATLFVTFALSMQARAEDLKVAITFGFTARGALDIIQILFLAIFLVGLVYAVLFLSYRVCKYAVLRWGRGLWSRLCIAVLVISVLAAPVVWSALTLRLIPS